MPTQDEIFLTEGNNWFNRNKDRDEPSFYELINCLRASKLLPRRILDIGCSNGKILNQISNIFPDAECHGVDPSDAALDEGSKRFPHLKLRRGVSHDLKYYADGSFDLVIISFVMHWIDRSRLLGTVAEIDRLLQDFGHLIIQDFAPSFAYRTHYHHLPNEQVFTYKQPYWDIFTSNKMYSVIFEKEYKHCDEKPFENRNLCKISVLQKRSLFNYPIV